MKTTSYLLLICVFGTSLISSCKKKPLPAQAKSPISCFQDSYNGTYRGILQYNGVETETINISLTKTSCTTCSFTSTGFPTIYVTNLYADDTSLGYFGTVNGEQIVFGLINSSDSLTVGGVFDFFGGRQ